MNDLFQQALAQAEQFQKLERYYEAGDYYDQAIAISRSLGNLRQAGQANEKAALLYLNWGKTKIAAGYLQEAHDLYIDGCLEKEAEALERGYPQFLQSQASLLSVPRSEEKEVDFPNALEREFQFLKFAMNHVSDCVYCLSSNQGYFKLIRERR